MALCLLLTHGARFHADSELLVAVDEAVSKLGVEVERYNLPFRQANAAAFPTPEDGPRDRKGLREAVRDIQTRRGGPLWIGGQSYGALQATLLAAEDPALATGLLLLSYPLAPGGGQPLTDHFPRLKTPALFVHGSADPLGSLEGIREAMRLIPARTELAAIEGAGHALGAQYAGLIAGAFERFLSGVSSG